MSASGEVQLPKTIPKPQEHGFGDSKSIDATRGNNANDSGYASQASTTNTTPSSSLGVIPQTTLPRSSRQSNVSDLAEFHISPSKGFLKRKKLVTISEEKPDEAMKIRFATIKPSFEKLLLNRILASQKAGTKYKPMATRLMMIGEPEQKPSPHIVIFCQPEQKDVIRRFAKSDIIKDLCKPTEPGGPCFQISITDNAPRLRTAWVSAETARLARGPQRTTMSGIPICLEVPGTPIREFPAGTPIRKATFGGIIKLSFKDSSQARLYGMTAGHMIGDPQKDTATAPEPVSMQTSDAEDEEIQEIVEESEADDMTDDSSDEQTDVYLIEFDLVEPENAGDMREEVTAWEFGEEEPPRKTLLGRVVSPNVLDGPEKGRSKCDYDWVLFETSEHELNKLPCDGKATITLARKGPGHTGDRAIYMISGSSGVKEGTLSSEAGRILLGSGEEFVDAYMVAIDDEIGICDGDSGSWIVDRDTFELYGHLVASDVFNGGYVIPMAQVFDDIKQQFGAWVVELPSAVDIFLAQAAERESWTENLCQLYGRPRSLSFPFRDPVETTDHTAPPSTGQGAPDNLDDPTWTQLDFPTQNTGYPRPQQSELSRLISQSRAGPWSRWGNPHLPTTSPMPLPSPLPNPLSIADLDFVFPDINLSDLENDSDLEEKDCPSLSSLFTQPVLLGGNQDSGYGSIDDSLM